MFSSITLSLVNTWRKKAVYVTVTLRVTSENLNYILKVKCVISQRQIEMQTSFDFYINKKRSVIITVECVSGSL